MPLRVLKNRGFSRACRKNGLTDGALCEAVAEIEAGLIDARLGGSLLKKRIAKGSRGKSSSFRTIVAYRQRDRLVFLYVFGKNEQDNITEQERAAL
ncbi:MAG: type II toxin-antitoxin system RelE/ParE family toxin [Acetobacteraceae bacterium]